MKTKGWKGLEKAFGGWGEKKIKKSAYLKKIKLLQHRIHELEERKERHDTF